MKGKVAIQAGPEKIEYKEYELPEVEKGALLLKVLKTNICGSDIHIWEGNHPVKNVVLGHELVGEVYILGENVDTDYAGQPIKVGDRVAPVYFITCLKCKRCLEGKFNQCENAYSIILKPHREFPHFVGSFATHYYVSPKQYFYKVPDNVTDNMAAGANCALSQMLFSIDEIGVNAGEYVLIMGAGGLGLYSSAICKEKGAKVIVFDSIEKRLAEAKNFGADFTININEYDTSEKKLNILKKITNNASINVIIDVTGVPQAFKEATELIDIGGKILEVGTVNVAETANVSVLPGLITRKCISVFGVLRYDPRYLFKALQFLSRNADIYPFGSLSDKEYGFDEIGIAFQKAKSREVGRAVIVPNK